MTSRSTTIKLFVFLAVLLLLFGFRNQIISGVINSNISPAVTETLEQIGDSDFFDVSGNVSNDGTLTREGIINETNKHRQTEKLSILRSNSLLTEAAQLKLEDLFAQDYFAHISPDGKGPSDLATKATYEYIVVAENLALGDFKSDEEVVTSWMNSPGHRANIMDEDYQEIGVAVGKGEYEGRTTWIAVQEFGTPLSACGEFNESRQTLINSYKDQLTQWDTELKVKKERMNSLPPHSDEYQAEFESYNQLVRDYNDLSRRTKSLLNEYNTEAKAYNECLDAFKE